VTNAERQFKAKLYVEGLVQVNLWVPRAALPDFQRAAELAREDRNLTVARMVHCRTGRLAGLTKHDGGAGRARSPTPPPMTP
jgi:hypothetical protein